MAKSFNKNIVILTGAGISAESGVKTFRDNNGLWENHRIEDVATPEAFLANPNLVHTFYNARRAQLNEVTPNAAHLALADLEKSWSGNFLLITQNVDDLHDRAQSKKLLHMHGELKKIFCTSCVYRSSWTEDLSVTLPCPQCKRTASLRPDIVWFGEMPYGLDDCYFALENADYFIAIGTSGNVYPAAGFVMHVPDHCITIEVNAADTEISANFKDQRCGPATDLVPALVKELLSGHVVSQSGL